MIIPTIIVLTFVLMVVISNVLSAIPKIGQKGINIGKLLYNIFMFLFKPLVNLIIYITQFALLTIFFVLAVIFGIITFGAAYAPIMSLYNVVYTQLNAFRVGFNALTMITDKNINIVTPVIDRSLAMVTSFTDFLYHSIKK